MRISDWSSDVCSSDLADAAAVVGELLESVLADAIGAGEATDAVIAQSGEQAKALWRIREGISEAQVRAGKTIKHDIALPIGRLADLDRKSTRLNSSH